MTTTVRLGILLCAVGPLLPAQQQATTLAGLGSRASVVVAAVAARSTDLGPDFQRVEFAVTLALRGDVGRQFSVLEPAGRCCGLALAAVEPGAPYLLFLERRGPALHPLGGDRGLVPSSPELLAHVTALLQARTPALHAAVLLAGLEAGDDRVRTDAALALAAARELPQTDAAASQVRAACLRELERASAVLPALLDVAVRMPRPDLQSALVLDYLDEPRPPVRELLRTALGRLPSPRVLDALLAANHGGPRAARIAELLAAMPDPAAVPLLERLLAAASLPAEQLALSEALLAAGVPTGALRGRVPAVVLATAERRRLALPTFRYVPSSRKP